MPRAISEKIVADLPAPAKGNRVEYFSGSVLQGKRAPIGFGVQVTEKNHKSFVLWFRKDGMPYRPVLGSWLGNEAGGKLTAVGGILAAQRLVHSIFAEGAAPPANRARRKAERNSPAARTLNDVIDTYLERHVRKLRSGAVVERTLDRLIRPKLGHIRIHELKRSQIVDVLNNIGTENGETMARRTRSHLASALKWHEQNDDHFHNPLTEGAGQIGKDQARSRTLNDTELREVWAALDQMKPAYVNFVRFTLLTATRHAESRLIDWREVDDDNVWWVIPAARYKGKTDHLIPLSPTARALLGDRGAGRIFSPSDSASNRAKKRLDQLINAARAADGREPIEHWTIHDLRRTARSLLARAGILPHIGERCLGHRIKGIEGVYNRHDFAKEKRHAFEALAAEVARIMNPPSGNVTSITAHCR